MPPTRPTSSAASSAAKPKLLVIAQNRAVFANYTILESFEAGLILQGTEIKSLREGRVDLSDAYAFPENGELWLLNAHIPLYSKGGPHNHEPRRKRKLLLHHSEIVQLTAGVAQKGFTIVPLRLYIKKRVAKVELGLAKGKRQYEKRERIAEREVDRQIQRAMRRRV
ncbi:MAG: SsrA-binding protein SmpB [Dehalococcoidia bacterium]|nr:SsrA-binding protein SmpB [Dehalococcoidia bacterium]